MHDPMIRVGADEGCTSQASVTSSSHVSRTGHNAAVWDCDKDRDEVWQRACASPLSAQPIFHRRAQNTSSRLGEGQVLGGQWTGHTRPHLQEMKLILQEVIQSEVNKGVITARKTEQAALPCEAGGPGSFPPRVTFRSRQEVI